jgi:hypothetical protein
MERQFIRARNHRVRPWMGGNTGACAIHPERVTFSFCSPIIAAMTDLNLGLPTAWVVKCKKCGCTINCRAIDPQVAYLEPDKAEPPPQDTVLVTCSCCWAAYRYSPAEVFKGPPRPSSNCYNHGRANNRANNR